MKIKILAREDVAQYRSLRLESLKESPFAFSDSYGDINVRPIEEFHREIAPVGTPPEAFVLGAFNEKGIMVGFVRFRRDQRQKARHKSMVHSMYTTPELRGLGVGKQLMEDLFDKAAQLKGLEQIHLWVLHNGTSASGFYRKLGFKQQGPFIKQDLKIEDAYIDAEYMVRIL